MSFLVCTTSSCEALYPFAVSYPLFQSCFFSVAASKARRPYQFSGKITVKAKEKSYSKLEIPYQAEVLDG